MKNLKTITFALTFFFIAVSVLAQQVETRNVGSFSKIHSGGSWDVIIQKGNKDEVRLESKNISLDKVITEVSNNTLKISLEKGNYRNIGLTVYVTARDVDGLKSSGSGNIKVETDISSRSLSINNSGSGNIHLQMVRADDLSVGMTGSGNISVEGGNVGSFTLTQTGSGDFKGREMAVENAEIKKTGSGSSYIGDTENLTVRATGSGNVYYSGNPNQFNVSSTGSSKTIKK